MPTLAGGLVLQETSDLRLRIVKVNDAGQAGGLPNLGVDQHLRGVHEFALQTVGAECDGEAVRAINQQCELICQSMGIARAESVRKCTQPLAQFSLVSASNRGAWVLTVWELGREVDEWTAPKLRACDLTADAFEQRNDLTRRYAGVAFDNFATAAQRDRRADHLHGWWQAIYRIARRRGPDS
jgi:hypothetical protein